MKRSQFWTLDSPGVKGVASRFGRFGNAQASGDFDGDGRSDLVLVTDSDGPAPVRAVGALIVLRGTPTGVTTTGAIRITRDTPGVAGTAEFGDLGPDLAVGDVNGDGLDDLAVSNVEGSDHRGGFFLFTGSADVIVGADSPYVDVDTPGLAPPDSDLTQTVTALAIGHLDGDRFADLAVGWADDGPSGSAGCFSSCPGFVQVLHGSALGLTLTGIQEFDQDTPGVPGTPEGDDFFGASLAVGDLDHDGHDDLAVGASGETIGSRSTGSAVEFAGAVDVLYQSQDSTSRAWALSGAHAQGWTQDSPGVAGSSEQEDYLGQQLRSLNLGHGSAADLIVAVPGEAIGSVKFAGGINILYGTSTGLSSAGNHGWSQNSPGLAGVAEAYDDFGHIGGHDW